MSALVNAASPVSLFDEATSEIDKLFTVSEQLKIFFVSSLKNAAHDSRMLRTQSTALSNAAIALEQIQSSSIKKAEKDILATLYRQGLISVVSAAEQILKSTFNGLLAANIKTIAKNEKFTIELEELKSINFQTDIDFWINKLTDELYGGKGAQEKLNFQNIMATENLFSSYFGLDLSQFRSYPTVSRLAHYFYQVRHILLHNAGYIDKRFIDNLNVIGMDTKKYLLGKQLVVQSDHYNKSKQCFFNLFTIIEAAIEAKNLIVDASI